VNEDEKRPARVAGRFHLSVSICCLVHKATNIIQGRTSVSTYKDVPATDRAVALVQGQH
jgi:hypothetical protein